MITFLEIGSLGRLGNQFFQYAALKSLGIERNYEVMIPNPKYKSWHNQGCLLGNFNLECGFLDVTDYKLIKKINHNYREPDYMKYDETFFDLCDWTNIHGFFQSTWYFEKHQEQIRKELTPNLKFIKLAKEKIKALKQHLNKDILVSIHIRRGDNTDNSNVSSAINNMYGKDKNKFSSISYYHSYYWKAIHFFKKKYNKKVQFLVFTGGSRAKKNDNTSDINWCKNNFAGEEFIFSESNDAMLDFSLITNCDHNIISPISSFGWWAAFLNSNSNKMVLAPKKYDPNHFEIDYRPKFYPKEWRIIE